MQSGNVPVRTEISYQELAKKWTDITVLKLRSSLQEKRIGTTGNLYNSFSYTITGNGFSDLKITLQYNYYGKFVDMGVRKGIKLADAIKGKKADFKKRNWYSIVMATEMAKLGIFLASKAGANAADQILSAMPKRIEIKVI